MNLDVKIFAKSVPGICIALGAVFILISKASTEVSLMGLGVFLLIAGIGLQVLYLVLRYSNRNRD